MKAAYLEQTGPPDVIVFGDLPPPEPIGSQVLVKVGAVAVNPIDTYIRGGVIQMELPMPYIPGCDLAGTVQAVGPDATLFKPGDRVWGTNQGLLGRQGTFSEYAAVDECWLYPSPEKVTDEDLAAISLVGVTAHLGLFRDAAIDGGETLFVNGGSGGVGSTVVQMAKAAGARVATTAGSDEKVKSARTWVPTWPSTTRPRMLTLACRTSPLRGSTCGGRRCGNRTSIGPFRCWPNAEG